MIVQTAKPRVPEDILLKAARDPVVYARAVLAVSYLAPYQERILRDLVTNEQTAARSANGVGKSYLAGIAASWFFDCRARPLVFIAGPKLEKALIPYRVMLDLRQKAPFELPGETYGGGFYGDESRKDWKVVPVTARDAESFAGMHAGDVLAIVEEASGEPDPIYEAIFGCITGPRDRGLHIGNPTRREGVFARLFKMPGVAKHTISAFDSPNVIEGREVVPGLVSRQGVQQIVDVFGRDSDVARVRVFGLPPRGAGDNIFGIDTIAEALGRGRAPEPEHVHLPEFGGLDLARMGLDASVLIRGRGKRVVGVDKWEKLDAVESAERVLPWLLADKRRILAIDAGNIGAAVFDTLRRRAPGQCIPVNFGGRQVLGKMRPNAGEGYEKATPWYFDRRSELWYEAAAWLRDGGEISGDLPQDVLDELEADLLAPVGGDAPNGSLRMETKDKTRARLGRSPDLGDAFCLCVAASMWRLPASAPRENDRIGVFGNVLHRLDTPRLRAVPDERPARHFPEWGGGGRRRAAREFDGW